MSVRILVGTIVAMALLLNGCGQSQDEKEKIAAVTCAIMVESRNMDASIRVEKLNEARDKIGGEPFLDGDDAIKEAFEYGLCQELVLNETYDQSLQYLKEAERERERIAAEKRAEEQRIAAEKQRIADSKPKFWSNGQLKERINYQSVTAGGEKHGLAEAYYENGQLRYKINYKDGKVVDGIVVEKTWENGQLKFKNNQLKFKNKLTRYEQTFFEVEELLMTTNLNNSRKVMQVTVYIMTAHDERVIAHMEKHHFPVRVALLRIMAAKTEADLARPTFREELAEEFRLEINSVLERLEDFGGVESVGFTAFVVQ